MTTYPLCEICRIRMSKYIVKIEEEKENEMAEINMDVAKSPLLNSDIFANVTLAPSADLGIIGEGEVTPVCNVQTEADIGYVGETVNA